MATSEGAEEIRADSAQGKGSPKGSSVVSGARGAALHTGQRCPGRDSPLLREPTQAPKRSCTLTPAASVPRERGSMGGWG